jgi:TRAP-type C4-dicarboxylate transport system permease small subunit
LETLIRRAERATMAVGVLCVTLIMLIVCYDAVGRYGFGSPLPWSFDLVSNYLMVGAAYFALSSTFRHGDHININLVHAKLPPRIRAWVDIVCCLLSAAFFAAIAYGAAASGFEAWRDHEFLPGIIMWPVWVSYLPIALGSALLVLRLLHHSAALGWRGEDPSASAEGQRGVK